jgi:hypothetical protein
MPGLNPSRERQSFRREGRQPFGERLQRRLVRMADRHHEALPARHGLGLGQLAAHRVERVLVVEEDMAHDGRHAELVRELVADRLRRGARIEEHQAARLDLAQRRLHAGAVRREATAHVVVDADIAVETVECAHDALPHLGVRQRDQQRIRTGIVASAGLHR